LSSGALIIALTGLAGCGGGLEPGVSLVFDDYFIDQWYGEKERFEGYGARATFSLALFDTFDEEEIGWLHELEGDGHEIGCHSLTHVNPLEFLEEHTVDDYMAQEIEPAITLMEAEGFTPTSFTFPWDGQTDDLSARLKERFTMLRGSGRFDGPQDIYYGANDGQLVAGARLDSGWWTEEQLDHALTQAAQRGEVLVVYAHRIQSEETEKSHIKPDELETALQIIDDHGLPYVTLSELPGLAEL